MNFKQFLIEAKHKKRSHKTSALEAIDFIKMNCSEITKQYKNRGKRIYRGILNAQYKDDFLYGDSETSVRKSRNTKNYYTLIMDNSSQWENFPKRSKSFVCSSGSNYASDFGYVFVAFPVDGTDIGICPTFDLWGASEKKHKGVDYDGINSLLFNFAHTNNVKIDDSNYQRFKDSLNALGKKIKNAPPVTNNFKHYERDFKNKLIKNADDLMGYLETVFSPEKFELQNTKNFNPPADRELWFSGKCIFVANREVYNIIKAL
jgi:hypothetical protein